MFKKNHFVTAVPLLFLLNLMLFTACEKEEDDKTDPEAPLVYTGAASVIGQNWASMRGSVNANGSTTTVIFEYSASGSFENSTESTPQTVEADNYEELKATIHGLETATTYYYRLIATNQEGTTTGSDTMFTTLNTSESLINFNPQSSYGTVDDIDGNTYKTIEIGTQTWMAENLRTLSLNDGSDLPYYEDYDEWRELETPGYCWYDTDTSTYGALYNWYAVNTEKLCPEGWSVPTDEDWNTLVEYLGGEGLAASYLKESGNRHWSFTSVDVTNDSGFTALPGGYRNLNGTYGNLGNSGYFWSSSEGDVATQAYYRSMYYGYSNVDRATSHYRTGFSVRCIQDQVTR